MSLSLRKLHFQAFFHFFQYLWHILTVTLSTSVYFLYLSNVCQYSILLVFLVKQKLPNKGPGNGTCTTYLSIRWGGQGIFQGEQRGVRGFSSQILNDKTNFTILERGEARYFFKVKGGGRRGKIKSGKRYPGASI